MRRRNRIDIDLLKAERILVPTEKGTKWLRYKWRKAHPLLQYLPTKLAEYLGDALSDLLNIPPRTNAEWTVEELNEIILNCVVAQSDGNHLEPWREIQWECDAFRGVSTARCCPTPFFHFRNDIRQDVLMTIPPKPHCMHPSRFRLCCMGDIDELWIVRPQLFFNVQLCPWGKTGPESVEEHYEASLVFFSTFEPTNLTPGQTGPLYCRYSSAYNIQYRMQYRILYRM